VVKGGIGVEHEIAEGTVKRQMDEILSRLEVSNRTQPVAIDQPQDAEHPPGCQAIDDEVHRPLLVGPDQTRLQRSIPHQPLAFASPHRQSFLCIQSVDTLLRRIKHDIMGDDQRMFGIDCALQVVGGLRVSTHDHKADLRPGCCFSSSSAARTPALSNSGDSWLSSFSMLSR
jgi:hypothetical protein